METPIKSEDIAFHSTKGYNSMERMKRYYWFYSSRRRINVKPRMVPS